MEAIRSKLGFTDGQVVSGEGRREATEVREGPDQRGILACARSQEISLEEQQAVESWKLIRREGPGQSPLPKEDLGHK